MNALRDPVSKYRSVVTGSPPRVNKPTSRTRAQPILSTEPDGPSNANQIHPFFRVNPKAGATASVPINNASNALKLSQGSKRVTDILAATSAHPVQQRRQLATTSKARPGVRVSKKPSNTRKESQIASISIVPQDSPDAPEPNPELPNYSYSSFKPTPILKYIRTDVEANKALENINGPLGFDLEWRVQYRQAPKRPVAVVQIASERAIYVIQTIYMKTFPKKLREILEDPTIVKAGVNVRGDASKLYTDHNIKIQNLVELSWLSRSADPALLCGGKPTARTLISLQKLVAAYLGQNLAKSEVRTGNWEAKLGQEQLEYAANDAHCAVILYNQFLQLAKKHKRTLVPHVFTLNVNLQGQVVADTETPAYEEVDPEEEPLPVVSKPIDEKRPAFAIAKPASKSKSLASTSESDSVAKPLPSRIKSTSSSKVPAVAIKRGVPTRPIEIIELDSETDTDDELRQLAEDFASVHLINTAAKRQPPTSAPQVPTFTSISQSRFTAVATSASRPSIPPLNHLEIETTGLTLGGTAFVSGERSGVSRTMAYALGIKK